MLDKEKTITLTDGKIITIIGPIKESNFDNNTQEYTNEYIEAYLKANPSLHIKELLYPETIEEIFNEDNYFAKNAKKIVLPSSLKRIGSYTFYHNDKTSLIVIKSAEKIENNAFCYCYKLKEIVLPNNLKRIEYDAFGDCYWLENINIPEGVERIGNYAFTQCFKLNGVVLPSTLKEIGSYAFNQCFKLNNINIPEGIKSIGCHTFCACEELSEVYLPNTLEYIDKEAFIYCKSLRYIRIPDSVGVIESGCFKDCENLTSVILSKNLIYIENETFYNCKSLANIIIPEGVRGLKRHSFCSCSSLKTIVLPSTLDELYEEAFLDCDAIESIIIPPNIEQLVKDQLPKKLIKKIIINENISREQNYILNNDSQKKETKSNQSIKKFTIINIPDNVEVIESNAFLSCNMQIVNLPPNLKQIDNIAFGDCTKLKTITIPNKTEEIGSDAFNNCKSLESIYLPKSLKKIGIRCFCECSSLKEIIIPDNVEDIGCLTFINCSSLKKVILSNKIKMIDSYTFYSCSSLEEIVIPEGVEKISYSALYYCKNLKRIVLPSTLKEIDTEAFTGCSSLKEIDTYESVRKVIKDTVNYLYQDHDLEIFYIDDEKKLDPNELIDLVIPKGTTILTKDIVENNKNLKNIKIPSSIKIIDKEAFKDCQFTSIYISEGIETIEDNAFENCQELTKIRLPNTLKEIKSAAFKNCSSLEKIEIPEGVELLGQYCFDMCTSLVKVILPSTLKTISEFAFSNCKNLESIKIPEGIENIYAKTFINCQSLKEVIFPSTMKKLEFFAFANCDLLKKNIFPEGVEEIDVDNKSIENLILPSTIKEIFIATTGFTSLKKLYLHVNDTVNYSNMYSNGLLDNINNIEEIVLIYNTTPDLIAFINRPSNKSFLFLSLKQSNSNYKLKLVGPSLSLPEYLLVFGNLPNKSKISFVNPDKIPDETETKLYKYVKESKLNKLINKIYQDTAYLPRKTKVAINKEIEEQLEEYYKCYKSIKMSNPPYSINYNDSINSIYSNVEKILYRTSKLKKFNEFAITLRKYRIDEATLNVNKDSISKKILDIILCCNSFKAALKKETLSKVDNCINDTIEQLDNDALSIFNQTGNLFIPEDYYNRIIDHDISEIKEIASKQYKEMHSYNLLLYSLKEFHPRYDIEADDLISFIDSIQYVLTKFPDYILQNEYKQKLKNIGEKYIPTIEDYINNYPNLIIPNLYETIEKNLRYDLQDYLIKLKDVKFNKDIIIKLAEEDYKARKERLLTELNNCLIIVTNGLKTKEKEDSDTNIGILAEIQTIENEYLNNEFIDFEIKIIIRLQLIAIIENNIERVINNVKDIVSYFEEKNILVNELEDLLFDIHRLIQKTNTHQERTHI